MNPRATLDRPRNIVLGIVVAALAIVARLCGRSFPGVLQGVLLVSAVLFVIVLDRAGIRRHDDGDRSWVTADLSAVPYVIAQPEARGHVLPWYRRVFARTSIEPEASTPMTYRG